MLLQAPGPLLSSAACICLRLIVQFLAAAWCSWLPWLLGLLLLAESCLAATDSLLVASIVGHRWSQLVRLLEHTNRLFGSLLGIRWVALPVAYFCPFGRSVPCSLGWLFDGLLGSVVSSAWFVCWTGPAWYCKQNFVWATVIGATRITMVDSSFFGGRLPSLLRMINDTVPYELFIELSDLGIPLSQHN